jgi:POT family proton-dependent oligopeptide transporter
LGKAGLQRGNDKDLHVLERTVLYGGTIMAAIVLALAMFGLVQLNPVWLAKGMAYVILGIAVFFFLYAFLFCGLDKVEKERVTVILILFLSSALFWAGFEQAGSSFNLFAERYTERYLSWAHYEVPAAWFQALGPVFIITLAPLFAGLWVWLARRNLDPSIPVKFAWGLLLLGAGFMVMEGASKIVASGQKVWPTWLIATYLLHTFGELCLSPVGLSSVTKLSPRKLAGQMMGVWFLATSLGNLIAGLLAGEFKADALQQWPSMYYKIVILPVVTGVVLLLLSKPIKRLLVGVK